MGVQRSGQRLKLGRQRLLARGGAMAEHRRWWRYGIARGFSQRADDRCIRAAYVTTRRHRKERYTHRLPALAYTKDMRLALAAADEVTAQCLGRVCDRVFRGARARADSDVAVGGCRGDARV